MGAARVHIPQQGTRRVRADAGQGPEAPYLSLSGKVASTSLDRHGPCDLVIITIIIGAVGAEGPQTMPPSTVRYHNRVGM